MDETTSPIPLSTAVARVLAGIGYLNASKDDDADDRHADDADHETPEVSHQASPSC